jgi:hypothetical protein
MEQHCAHTTVFLKSYTKIDMKDLIFSRKSYSRGKWFSYRTIRKKEQTRQMIIPDSQKNLILKIKVRFGGSFTKGAPGHCRPFSGLWTPAPCPRLSLWSDRIRGWTDSPSAKTCSKGLKTNPKHPVALQGVLGHSQKLVSQQLSVSVRGNSFLLIGPKSESSPKKAKIGEQLKAGRGHAARGLKQTQNIQWLYRGCWDTAISLSVSSSQSVWGETVFC